MIFTETRLPGAYLVDLEKRGDDRGFFARAFCEKEFGAQKLATRFVQVNDSLSARRGTLRGMHYQLAPRSETKLVRCIRGALFDVILEAEPKRALQRCEAEAPDLIVLDVMMPELDGYEVAKRLRANPHTCRIPILMFTAKTQLDDKVSGFDAGADDYLTKPFNPRELVARIRAVLPTIHYCLEGEAKVILASHMGRPKGKRMEEFSLAPVARRLAYRLHKQVRLAPDCVGPETEQLKAEMKPR